VWETKRATPLPEIAPVKTTASLLTLLALGSLLALQPAFAESPKASEQSVQQLLEAMHTGETLKDAFAHMDDMMRTSMKDQNGRPLNAEQQKIRDETRARVVALMKQQLDWSTTLEPIMVESYRDTFTQQEVDAQLKFYGTPVGKSVAAKLPVASQQMVHLMQQRIREIMPQIQEMQRDAAARIKAAADSGAEPAQPAH
jgi:uncharacterized protein